MNSSTGFGARSEISSKGSVAMRDLDLSGVFTPTYMVSVLFMLIIAVGGLLVASMISP